MKTRCHLREREPGKGFVDTEGVENQYWERDGIIPEVTHHTANNLIPGNNTVQTVIPALRVTATTVKLTVSGTVVCPIKTLIWSLHSHHRVRIQWFIFRS